MMFECIDKIYPSVSIDTVTGNICSFNSQYAGLPLKSHKIALTATQSGSGTPSPSNPRPISGYSAINISHSDADTSNPTVYVINLGGTYYFGEYDARTGVLTITHKGVDLGSLTWTYRPSGLISVPSFISNQISDYKVGSVVTLCSCFEIVPYRVLITDNYQIAVSNITNATDVVVRYDEITTEADLTTALSGQYMVYELATPIEIPLGGINLLTQEGVNNIYADCGDTTVEYIKIV